MLIKSTTFKILTYSVLHLEIWFEDTLTKAHLNCLKTTKMIINYSFDQIYTSDNNYRFKIFWQIHT